MAALSIWLKVSRKRKAEIAMALVMIPAAFFAPLILSGRGLVWGLPVFMLAMFAVVDVMRLGRRNLTARDIAHMLFLDALVILPFHLLLLWGRGIL